MGRRARTRRVGGSDERAEWPRILAAGGAAWPRILAAGGAALVLALGLAAGCVDGVTPDCSDAATPCGPVAAPGSPSREASTPPLDAQLDVLETDATGPDAESDADLDAGDEV